jgi:hypothetical protein
MGASAKPASADLHKLLGAPEYGIRHEAALALHAIHDPSVVVELAQRCRPTAELFDATATDTDLCLSDIADFGPDGHEAGKYLLPFLDSKNGAEQSYGIIALGLIGYTEAAPQIEAALRSPDWRIVNAAGSSLGWLGDRNALPDLDRVATAYWLPEVRQNAAKSANAIRSPEGRLSSGEAKLPNSGYRAGPFDLVTDGLPRIELDCKTNQWRWKNQTFKLSRVSSHASSLQLRNDTLIGDLVGTNNGEWGGQLAWLPGIGKPEILVRDNVAGIESASDDGRVAIVFLGLAHMGFDYGYVLKVSIAGNGTGQISEIARLPGEPVRWSTLGPGLFAVKANDRVVVISSSDGILGLAECAAN